MISLLGNLPKNIRGSSNGRTAAFEAANRGSNPCPRTQKAAVLELVDRQDLKSCVRKSVWVRFPPAAQKNFYSGFRRTKTFASATCPSGIS